MKIIFTNLLSIIRRFKLAWLMNFVGISAALAALMFVTMQIVYENSFDRCHKNADRIFLVAEDVDIKPFNIIIDRYNLEIFGNCSPKVEAYSSVIDMIQDCYVEVEANDGERHGFYEHIAGVDSSFINIFDFDISCGDPKNFCKMGDAIINESMAKRMFGTSDVVGRRVGINDKWCVKDSILTIAAVYKDFPDNTQIHNAIYYVLNDEGKDGNSGRNFLGWLMLSSPDDKDDVETLMNNNPHLKRYGVENGARYYLEPLVKTYYLNENDAGFVKGGSRSSTSMLTAIALVVLIISAINHTNFSIALIPMRIRSINTQKVLGCGVGRLRWQLFAENVIIGVVAWIVALLIVSLLNDTWITSFLVPKDLSISGNLGICMAGLVVSVAINVLAGVYPIIKLTSATPALVLKGSFGRSLAGTRLRNVLLVLQYFAAACFIAIAVCIWLQIRYIGNANAMLNDSQVAVFKTNQNLGNKCDLLVSRLKRNPAITHVAFTEQKVGACDAYNTMSLEWIPENDTIPVHVGYNLIFCSAEMPELLGVQVLDGNSFEGRADCYVSYNNYEEDCLITKSLADYGINVGDSVYGGVVKGIISDLRLLSYRTENIPLMFTISRAQWLNYCYVRIAKGCNIHDAIAHIESVVSDIAPEMPLEIEFQDKVFQRLYESEINTSATTVFMAMLAILISIIGVFGMVTFDVEYKRRDIAVRRVFGASVADILHSINIKYVAMVAIGCVLSIPVSLYVISNWQQNFVEKAPVPWWIFMVIFLIVALVTVAIVTVQSFRAVSQNPSEGLKTE